MTGSGPRVAIARCGTYDQGAVDAALAEALRPFGGMGAFVKRGRRVCLKPNLLMKAVPERAVTTHPAVLRAVIRQVKTCDPAEILVGDSPAGRQTRGMLRAAWDAAGFTEVCAAEDVRLVVFEDDVVRVPNPNSSLYASFNIARAVAEADVVIDLPKLKTHGFQQYTGAVKNLFGCIPGLEKGQFHLKVPDRDDFGRMLVDLMLACEPTLAVMDGIVGMEGEGPGGGDPIEIGALIVSDDCVALDVVASAIAGFDPMDVYTNKAAHARGLGPRSADDVEMLGVEWREVAPASFKRPARDMGSMLPPALGRWLRARTASRPYLARPEECTACRTCERNCPVGAVEVRDGHPVFDYDACIRCYCCQEMCPPQCIGLKTPWLVRAVIAREQGRKA